MRSSLVGGICLVLLLGCSSDKDANPSESAGGTTNGGAGGETTTEGGAGAGGETTTEGGSEVGGSSSDTGGNAGGGTTSTGGSSSSAGGSPPATFKCNNLLSAAGATGQAKPSGAVGGLKVLNWAGFKGAVSFTFDDNHQSQIDSMSALKATGARMTFFIVSSWANASHEAFKTAATEGHEIGNHTATHNATGDVADAQTCQTHINTNFGVTAVSLAAPYGDPSWAAPAKQLFIANRGVSDGLIAPRDGTDVFNLPAYIPPPDASSIVMDSAVDAARTAGGWKIFCVHGFGGGAWQAVGIDDMTTTMSNAVTSGDMWVDTMGNVVAYWLGQNAISGSATASTTWTLPEHFPPNMCVRVTTTGGTVKQNGTEVPWNEHGYYEISLDAKSVTVE